MDIRKVAIIGTGDVGSHCGFSLATQGVADEIVFIDINRKKAEGEALDLADAVSFLPHRVRTYAGDFNDCSDSDIVIISIGPVLSNHKTRLDMLEDTIKMLNKNNTLEQIVDSGFKGIFVCITNPADIIANYVREKTNFPKNKILSSGTILDSSRLKRVLARELNISEKSIAAYVLGEHGDSQMVPWSNVTIGGKPLLELMEGKPEVYGKLDLKAIEKEVRVTGDILIAAKGTTEFGVSSGATDIIKAILHDERRILPVSTYLSGEYGQENLYAGVPAIIGKNGVEEIIEIKLTDEEKDQFNKSCDVIREYIKKADSY